MPTLEEHFIQEKKDNFSLASTYLADEFKLIHEYASENNMILFQEVLAKHKTIAQLNPEQRGEIDNYIGNLKDHLAEHFDEDQFRASKIIEQVFPSYYGVHLLKKPVRQITMGGYSMKTFNAHVCSRAAFLLDLLAAKGEINEMQRQKYQQEISSFNKPHWSHEDDFNLNKYSGDFVSKVQTIVINASSDENFPRAVRRCFYTLKSEHDYANLYKSDRKSRASLKPSCSEARSYGRFHQPEPEFVEGENPNNNLAPPQKRARLG